MWQHSSWIFNADQAVNEDGERCRMEDFGCAYVGNVIPHDKTLEGNAQVSFAQAFANLYSTIGLKLFGIS